MFRICRGGGTPVSYTHLDVYKRQLNLLQVNYRAGLVAFPDVLTADVQFHQATIGWLQALAQRHQDTVALFVALGGGWWNEARPAAKKEAP